MQYEEAPVRHPGKLKFYKSTGAAQFTLVPPRRNRDGYVTKEGAILVEVAPGEGSDRNPDWNWSKKISFAISVADIMALNCNDKDQSRLFHKHRETPKTLQFQPGYNDTVLMNLAMGRGSDRNTVTVPLTGGEYEVIMKSLVAMVPNLLGWV